ncbi:hydantoinase/oxoprolinase family protein [Rivibacter subsaxonicus]|uniref:Putative H4MPT-linked C1 transfer pathway protein n=1 Tax=Rivibacter subsaxonicus TaxID=457575 RepID=A0A4Q7W0K2_9BURK|nr:hydantoinase/oxoprolinase family protein [Rivibacter subsaxonicus]RZU02711.1 putative H4MPT-linked C1 transfer pathway protein [Rivibacter subsaxonicus]
MPTPELLFGWDVGGAQLKLARIERGPAGAPLLRDAMQWPCALWQGLDRLGQAIEAARQRWPDLAQAEHALTMSGEMVDLFPDRATGVQLIVGLLRDALDGAPLHCYAGAQGWLTPQAVAGAWTDVASANWLACAELAAGVVGDGLLVDIGSTTTDLVALRGGRAAPLGRSDAQRLQSGELLYLGVARTPLMALAPRVPFQGVLHNVMNEYFATSADVYRLTGELDPRHDPHPAADNGAKDEVGTRRRLARMIGRDAHEGSAADWLALARHWRSCQLDATLEELLRVAAAAELPRGAPLVASGCGDFLVEVLGAACGRPVQAFGERCVALHPAADAELAGWAQVGAPAVAVALLRARA